MKQDAIIFYGRMNPPHEGHIRCIKECIKEAKKTGADFYIFASKVSGDLRNPLSYQRKLHYLDRMLGEEDSKHVVDTDARNPYEAVELVKRLGYSNVSIAAGEDRVKTYRNMFGDDNNYITFKRTDNDISSSYVRDVVLESDDESFNDVYENTDPEIVDDLYRDMKILPEYYRMKAE